MEFNSEVNWKFLVWTDLVFELLLWDILADFCFPAQVNKGQNISSSPVLEQVHSFPHSFDNKIKMLKPDTLIFYMHQLIFFHGLVNSIFSFSRIQTPNTFFKCLLPQCMEEAGHAMGWVLWHEAAAPALLSAQAFRNVLDRTHDKTVLVITTKSALIWTQGTTFCLSIPTLGPACP